MDIKLTKWQALERKKAGKRIDPVPILGQGKTEKKIASAIGISHGTLHKVKTIADKKPELIAKVDRWI